MSNILDSKNFYFKNLEGEDVMIYCEVYSYARGWGHRAYIVYDGERFINFNKRITYYNRTWEAFKFESVLYKVVSAFYPKKEAAFIKNQIKAIADQTKAELDAWMAGRFKKYNALSDETKETIKKADVLLTSREEADALINLSLLKDACSQ